jgi:hypothetical protein
MADLLDVEKDLANCMENGKGAGKLGRDQDQETTDQT